MLNSTNKFNLYFFKNYRLEFSLLIADLKYRELLQNNTIELSSNLLFGFRTIIEIRGSFTNT